MTALKLPSVLLLALLSACSATGCGDEAADSQIELGEWLPGGDTTNTLLLGTNAFIRHASNISEDNERMFFTGNSFFNQPWVEAPSSTQTRDGVGPLFNARSCSACHFRDGRGAPPTEADESFLGLLIRLSIPGEGANGAPLGDPNYGGQFQPFALDHVPAEGTPRVVYEETEGQYADGETFSLRHPTYSFDGLGYGPLHDDIMISARVAPQVIGLGLLEAIPEERLAELADPEDADDDGISGRMNRVWDVTREVMAVGRFGWKAEQPTVRQQSAGAFLGDMGLTTPLFMSQECSASQEDCIATPDGGAPEVEPHLFERVVVYTSLLAVPVRRDWEEPEVLLGKRLFAQANCTGCHTPSHMTGDHWLDETSNQLIWPYTDLLLHDMGPELADGRPVYEANVSEWRTPPLWGIGLFDAVNSHEFLLHDGRARGVAEAILWHGGEAEESREAFVNMSREERNALIRFVRTL